MVIIFIMYDDDFDDNDDSDHPAYLAYLAYLDLAKLAYLAYSAYLAYLAYLASAYLCVLLTNNTRIVHRCLARGTCAQCVFSA